MRVVTKRYRCQGRKERKIKPNGRLLYVGRPSTFRNRHDKSPGLKIPTLPLTHLSMRQQPFLRALVPRAVTIDFAIPWNCRAPLQASVSGALRSGSSSNNSSGKIVPLPPPRQNRCANS
jgi:hypothetical protein